MATSKKPDRKPSRRGFIRVVPRDLQVHLSGSWAERLGERHTGCDLAVYGLSFLVPKGPSGALSAGTLVDDLRFDVGGRQVTVRARVARFEPAGANVKIAVEFVEILPDDVWFLSSYVVKHGVEMPAPVEVPSLFSKKNSPKKSPKKKRAKPAAKKRAARKARAPKKRARSAPRRRGAR
jgi:hypothetical protein